MRCFNALVELLWPLGCDMTPWVRYVDDTFASVNPDSINTVLTQLNNFHPSIAFTYELEEQNRLPFLDVQVIRTGLTTETTVYRKPTNQNLYLHWNSFTPKAWRIGALKTLIFRALKVCSKPQHRDAEIEHIRKVFIEINGFPSGVVDNIISKMKEGIISERVTNEDPTNKVWCKLPYNGPKGEKLVKTINKVVRSETKGTTQVRAIYSGTKLQSCFHLKDKPQKQHEHNIIYTVTCPTPDCRATYIGETSRRLSVRVGEHSGKDKNSHVYKHSLKEGHRPVTLSNFTILNRNRGTNFKRKILEALYIKNKSPSLNVQEQSVQLKLF